jgi:hypothetical protein
LHLRGAGVYKHNFEPVWVIRIVEVEMIWLLAAIPIANGFQSLHEKAKKDKEFRNTLPWLTACAAVAGVLTKKELDVSAPLSKDELSIMEIPGMGSVLLYQREGVELQREWGTPRGAQILSVARSRFLQSARRQ